MCLAILPFVVCVSNKLSSSKGAHGIFTCQISQGLGLALPVLTCAWQIVALGPCSDAWKQTHRSSSYTQVTAFCRPAHSVLVVPIWKPKIFGFSVFLCKLQIAHFNKCFNNAGFVCSFILSSNSVEILGTFTSPPFPRMVCCLLTVINPLIP